MHTRTHAHTHTHTHTHTLFMFTVGLTASTWSRKQLAQPHRLWGMHCSGPMSWGACLDNQANLRPFSSLLQSPQVVPTSHSNLCAQHDGQCAPQPFKVQGSRFFIIRHIHNHTSIISSEMQVELKKNTAFTWGKGGEKNYPQTMLLGEYSVRTGKTPQQHKSTYTT